MAEGIERAGQFKIERADIITSAGLVQDIIGNIVGITIYESIGRSAISGDITFHDSFGFSNIGPLIGQEFLALKISTPTIYNAEDTIDFSHEVLHIRRVTDKKYAGQGSEMVTLQFVSSELMRSNRVRISESLEGSASEIVSQMLKRVECTKDMFIEPSIGTRKIVAPNLNPFSVIHMLTQSAMSNQSPATQGVSSTYMFWESLKGFHFRTLDSCMANGNTWEFSKYTPGSMRDSKGRVDINEELSNLESLEISHNDLLKSTAEGVLHSNLIVHNIHTKSYTTHEYNYFDEFDKEAHIGDGYPMYSKTPMPVAAGHGTQTVADINGKVMLQPVATTVSVEEEQGDARDATQQSLSGEFNYSPYAPELWRQQRASQMGSMDHSIRCKIQVAGNTVISAGCMVGLEIPFHADIPEQKEEKIDTFLQGAFLVRSIRHRFIVPNWHHQMNLDIVKNSVTKELDETESPEPQTEGQGVEHGDLYQDYPF